MKSPHAIKRAHAHLPVNVLDSATNLVRKVLSLLIDERMSRAQQLAHISIHKLCDNVDVIKSIIIVRLVNIEELQDIFMTHRTHETNLANDTLGVGQVIKQVGHFFHSNALFGDGIVCRTNDAIGAQA